MKNLPLSQISRNYQEIDLDGWQVHEKAMVSLANGEDVLALTIGDPDFDTPEFISKSLVESLRANRTHYADPQGELALRETLADLETRNTGKQLAADQFNIFNGAANALYSVLRCIANPGQNVVIIEPYYIGYRSTLNSCGLKSKICSTSAPEFEVSAAEVEACIDENTVAVLLNTPVNPTGNVVAAETMRAIYEICQRHRIWCISDEVYSLLYYDQPHTSMLGIVDDLENVVVIDSLSKSHAMTGWRIGWSVTNAAFAKLLSTFALGSIFTLNQFVQDAAVHALRGNTEFIEKMKIEYKKRRDYTMQRIRDINGLDAVSPSAGMFVMVNVHEDGNDFANRMFDEIGVAVAPGIACGDVTKNYVRVSYVTAIDQLERAWDRIADWMASRNDSVDSLQVRNPELANGEAQAL